MNRPQSSDMLRKLSIELSSIESSVVVINELESKQDDMDTLDEVG